MHVSQAWGRSNKETHLLSNNGQAFMVKTRASMGAEVDCKGREGTSTPNKERQRHKVWRLPLRR